MRNKFIKTTLLVASYLAVLACSKSDKEEANLTPGVSLSNSILTSLSAALSGTHVAAAASSKYTAQTDETLQLNEAQVDALIAAATAAVSAAGLADSTDYIALMPVIIQAAELELADITFANTAAKVDVIEVLGESLIASMNGNSDHLLEDSAEAGKTAYETAVLVIAESLIENMDSAGISSDDFASACESTVTDLVANLDEAGLTAAQVELAVGAITEGAVAGLDGFTAAGFDADDLAEVIAGISGGAVAGIDSIELAGYDVDSLADMVAMITAGATQGLDRFTMADYDSADLATMIAQIQAGAVSELDNISFAGYSATSLPNMVKYLTQGAIGALDGITMPGYSAADFAAMATAATAGAVGALDNITMLGYDFNDLESMVREIAAGATVGAGRITYEGYTLASLDAMIAAGTAGATGALDSISMVGYSATSLPNLVAGITAGATGALGYIVFPGYDFNYLDNLVKQVTAGATGALDSIVMDGYDYTDLTGMMERITAGATGALDSIVMTGYNQAYLQTMVGSISAGAVDALGDISMANYNAIYIASMIEFATAGTTGALGDITMDGYDANDIQGMITAISTGTTDAFSDIGGGYIIDPLFYLRSLAEGSAAGATYITDTFVGFDFTNMAAWVTTGAIANIDPLTGNAYIVPDLTGSITDGLNAVPIAYASFIDTNNTAGTIAGALTIYPAWNETNVASYKVYFGSIDPSGTTTKIGGVIATVAKNAVINGAIVGTIMTAILTDVVVPPNATNILIFAHLISPNAEASAGSNIYLMDVSGGLVLANAADTLLNGTYIMSGFLNERNVYLNTHGQFIFWEAGYWIVHNSNQLAMPGATMTMTTTQLLTMTKLYAASTASTPPASGWLVGSNASASPATLQ